MRITTGMTQRSTLADLNRINERVDEGAAAGELQPPDLAPVGRSVRRRPRAPAARVARRRQQYQRNIKDGQGWQETAEEAMSSITDSAQRARELLVQGTSDTTDPASRESIAKELDQLIAGIKQTPTRPTRAVTSSAAPPPTGAVPRRRDGHLPGRHDHARGAPGGPGVSLEVGITAESFLGSGSAPGDGKLLDTLRSVAANLRSGDAAGMKATSPSSTRTWTRCSARARSTAPARTGSTPR